MIQEEVDKRVHFLQYVNTTILTLIFGVAIMIFTTVTNVKNTQQGAGQELVRLKAVQDINITNVDKLSSRVNMLETNYVESLKNWIDANYIRKPQN